MADFLLNRDWMQELQSDWLRLSQNIRNVSSIEDALIQVNEIRKFLTPLIGDLLFDRNLWVNTETRGEDANSAMSKIRFDLDTFLVEIQDLLESMEGEILKMVRLFAPGSKEYEKDGGKTQAALKERGVSEEVYAWNRAKAPFLEGFSNISSILIDKFFPYLEESMETFDEFYGKGYDDELAVDDVLVTFTGRSRCSESQAKKYMNIVQEVAGKIKEAGLDKLWVGRIYIYCGKKDKERQVGVQYFSPPKDVIYVYDKPSPFLVDALLYAYGNKFYYGFIPQERRREFQALMRRPKRLNWGMTTRMEEPDFAKMFSNYIQGKMGKETRERFLPFLKEDFFQKMIRNQSKEETSPEERSVKLASLYLTSFFRRNRT